MKTPDKKLEELQRKIWQANPGYKIPTDLSIAVDGESIFLTKIFGFSRPSRLADVLLALAKEGGGEVHADGEIKSWNGGSCMWDLHADALSSQKPETIAFLHALLVTK